MRPHGTLRLRSVLVWNGAVPADGEGPDGVLFDAGLGSDPPSVAGASLICAMPPLAAPDLPERLAAAMRLAPVAVALPAVEGGADLQQLGARLAVAEAECGLKDGSTRILAWPADTPLGVLRLPSLVRASRRLAALLWDPGRLAAALAIGDEDAAPLRHAEAQLVLTARACGVPALCGREDRRDDDFDQMRRRGFGGAVLKSPDSIAAADAAFG